MERRKGVPEAVLRMVSHGIEAMGERSERVFKGSSFSRKEWRGK